VYDVVGHAAIVETRCVDAGADEPFSAHAAVLDVDAVRHHRADDHCADDDCAHDDCAEQ
jgi:hypothetical protein